jgi:UDP-N-acetylmuramoyl-tripeptide--D-alanyl-D-alanine ligase
MPGFVSSATIPAALAGLTVGTIYEINLVDGAEALKKMQPLAGHMRPLLGIKKTLIIDDTYNSSPDPVKSALEVMASLPKIEGAKKIAALGDMLELGPETEHAHREIGFKVVENGIDFLVTVGEASKQTAAAAKEAGLSEGSIASFATSAEAGKFIQEKLKENDKILVKGSQGSRMEKIVKEIMAEPLEARKLLVRQDDVWLNK